jgi:hypothetical protein
MVALLVTPPDIRFGDSCRDLVVGDASRYSIRRRYHFSCRDLVFLFEGILCFISVVYFHQWPFGLVFLFLADFNHVVYFNL